jgi:spore maturation protein CgeB
MAEMGWCPSGRLFEAAACGVPIISDWWDGLDSFFTPGQEILIAKSADETVNALSLTDAELYRIGQAGRDRILSEHTAEHRARELVEAVSTTATMVTREAPIDMPTTTVEDSRADISRVADRDFLRHCAEE